MAIPSFTQGYPPDGTSLGQTKTTIRDNLDGTFLTLAVDHINNNGLPGAKPAGYHKVIHMVPQAGNPVAVAGYGQLYARTITSVNNDQALFYETGGGRIAQLTMNINPVAADNGYTFLPGGVLIQWGLVNNPGNAGTVTFSTANIAFPTACFNVQLTARNDGSHSAFNYWVDTAPTSTEFKYQGSTSGSNTLFWVAIGN